MRKGLPPKELPVLVLVGGVLFFSSDLYSLVTMVLILSLA